jgi:hypothetical protein
MTDETRNTYVLLGFAALGLYLFASNRNEKSPDEIAGTTPEQDADRIEKVLLRGVDREKIVTEDLARLKRKLDRHAKDFDPQELERGTVHELEHTRNRLVAQKIAMDHLRENPDYYQILEEAMPEGA